MGLDFEHVFGAGFEEAQEILDNGRRGVVALEIDHALAIDNRSVDESGLLSVVDQIACVDACIH